jgi:tetratricopeptide (TPR) repeat protein
MGPMRAAALALLCSALAGAAPAEETPASAGPAAEAHRAERIARRSLEDARALVREGRLEHAEAALRRGLDAEPDHPRLHRALADLLEELGRHDEAARERGLADAIDPPAAPLPEDPLDLPAAGLLVVVLPTEAEAGHPERLAGGWPEQRESRALEARLAVRLRGARVVHADFASVAEARAWLAARAPQRVLTLRLDRAWCGDSIKDGRFALGVVRAAAAPAGAAQGATALGREVIFDPGPACEAEALARALERALAHPELAAALRAAGRPAAGFAGPVVRALFPGLGRRIEAEIRTGEQLLAAGEIGAAAEAFRRAGAVDPEDPVARAYLHEAEATLALAAELARRAGEPEGVVRLDPRMTEEQLAAAEARLRDEEQRRRELQAALAVLDEDVRAPDARLLAALRSVEIPDADAFGPSLARRRAGGEVEARVAYAPDGGLLARYYFPVGGEHPVLREDDTDGDRRADRWIAYEENARSEVYEARGADRPAVRVVFTEAGARVARVELDDDADGRPERILHYRQGTLSGEARDSDGDGRLDTFDRLDPEGRVALREEDVDGDGAIDVRSVYEAGRLIRRELSRPELVPGRES